MVMNERHYGELMPPPWINLVFMKLYYLLLRVEKLSCLKAFRASAFSVETEEGSSVDLRQPPILISGGSCWAGRGGFGLWRPGCGLWERTVCRHREPKRAHLSVPEWSESHECDLTPSEPFLRPNLPTLDTWLMWNASDMLQKKKKKQKKPIQGLFENIQECMQDWYPLCSNWICGNSLKVRNF